MKKLMIGGCARACLAGAVFGAACVAGLAARADDATTLYTLKWSYTGTEDFGTPSNWLMGETVLDANGISSATCTDVATRVPGAADIVRFGGAPKTGTDKTVRLSSDVVVSNFFYDVGEAMGTTLDLAGHTLTVSNNMSIKSGLVPPKTGGDPWLYKSRLTFKDGAVSLPGSQVGAKTYGQPDEASSGFFLNRLQSSQGGFNLVFDNASLVATNSLCSMTAQTKNMQGATSRIQLVNGASWTLSAFTFSCCDENSPIEFIAKGENTRLTITNKLTIGSSARIGLTFRDGAALDAQYLSSSDGAYKAPSNSVVTLDGGSHALGVAILSPNGALRGSLNLSRADLVVTNKAVLAAKSVVAARSAASITVCDGASLTSDDSVQIGRMVQGANKGDWGGASLTVDDGSVVAAANLVFGYNETMSNDTLRVVGAKSLVKATTGYLSINYGSKVAFEIPTDGYAADDGVARVPVTAAGAIYSKTTANCIPVALELSTKAFDKAHPKQKITLMQAGKTSVNDGSTYYTKDALAALTNNVTWVDNPRNHGELSISDDGLSLVYTASTPKGLMLVIR